MSNDETNASSPFRGLSSLMSASRILLLKGKQKKDDVLKMLLHRIASEERFGTEADLEWGVMHREELMSTGIGKNIAVPHTATGGAEDACVALAVCPDGILDYQTPDSLPVKLVFMIVTPKDGALIRLRVLGTIGELFSDGRLKAACLASGDPEKCLTIIQRAE